MGPFLPFGILIPVWFCPTSRYHSYESMDFLSDISLSETLPRKHYRLFATTPWKNHHLKSVESTNQSLLLTKLYANLQDPSDSFHATVYIPCQSIKMRCVFLKIPACSSHYPRSTTIYYLLVPSGDVSRTCLPWFIYRLIQAFMPFLHLFNELVNKLRKNALS